MNKNIIIYFIAFHLSALSLAAPPDTIIFRPGDFGVYTYSTNLTVKENLGQSSDDLIKAGNNMSSINSIFKDIELMKPPVGVNVSASGQIISQGGYFPAMDQKFLPLNQVFSLNFYALQEDLYQNLISYTDSFTSMSVRLNDVCSVFGDVFIKDSLYSYVYFKPEISSEIEGWPIYEYADAACIVISDTGKELWKNVSREQYLKIQISQAKKMLALFQSLTVTDLQNGSNSDSDSDNAFHLAFTQLSAYDPMLAEKMKKSNIEAETLLQSIILEIKNFKTLLEEELAALKPESKSETAWVSYAGLTDMKSSGLKDAEAEGSAPLCFINYDYFDKKEARTSIQLIVCRWDDFIPSKISGKARGWILAKKRLLELYYDNTTWSKIFNLLDEK